MNSGNDDQEMPIPAFPDRENENLPFSPVPQPGDHIYCRRRGFTHHGIFIDKGEVVHYSGLHGGKLVGPVVRTSLCDFLGGSDLLIRNYSLPKFTPKEITERALGRLGESLYHPLFNNCEHFSEWCVMKKHRSQQVDVYSAIGAGVPGYLLSKGGSKLAFVLRGLYKKYKKP